MAYGLVGLYRTAVFAGILVLDVSASDTEHTMSVSNALSGLRAMETRMWCSGCCRSALILTCAITKAEPL